MKYPPLILPAVLAGCLFAVAAPGAILIGGSIWNGNFNTSYNANEEQFFVDDDSDNYWYNIDSALNQGSRIFTDSNPPGPDGTRSAYVQDNGQTITSVDGRTAGGDFTYVVQPNDFFTISYDWTAEFNWESGDQIRLALYTTSGSWLPTSNHTEQQVFLSGEHSEFSGAPNGTADSESFVWVAPASLYGQEIYLKFEGLQGGASASFARLDNLVLEVGSIPEPSTLALLGIGSLLIAHCRRKRQRETQ